MSSVVDTKSEESLDFNVMFPILQKILGIKTHTELAERLGIQSQAISNAKNKGRMPIKWVNRLAQRNLITWEVMADLMQKGRRDPLRNSVKEPLREIEVPGVSGQDDKKIVPELSVPYGTEEPTTGRYRVLLHLLQKWVDETFPEEMRAGLFIWIVDEDNMEPTIPRKSLVLIDGTDKNLRAKGIFAFQTHENHLTLLRTSPREDGVNIDLINDNRNYSSNNVPEKSLMEGPRKVVGRVVFKGNRV